MTLEERVTQLEAEVARLNEALGMLLANHEEQAALEAGHRAFVERVRARQEART